MNELTHIPDELLVKMMLGEASEDEQLVVKHWLAEKPENRRYFEHFQTIWQTSRTLADHSTVDEEAAWQRFKKRTEAQGRVIPLNTSQGMFKWWSVAAAILIVAGAAWLFYQPDKLSGAEQISVRTTGETRKDTLPDGSVVTLNKNSSIAYNEAFTDADTREVTLNGEAFFEVAPDKSKPFKIHVNEVTVTVLGTSFNIKSTDKKTEVVVETGLVQVENTAKTVKARPQEIVTVTKGQNDLVKEKVTDEFYNYYRTHQLVCRQTPLHELVDVLNEVYQADIVIENPAIRNKEINTVFDNMPLNQVLNIISETLNISVVQQNQRIILK